MVTLWSVSAHKFALVATSRRLRLKEPFTIATKTWDVTENVFVELTWNGETGLGEVSPDDRWGDAAERVIRQLDDVDMAGLAGPFDLEGVSELLPVGAARCALDIAMHDLAAKVAGISVGDLLGIGGREAPVTSVTVPIADVDRMIQRARSLADHPVLKMKVGFDADVDVARAIREVYDGRIRIDANEGWDEASAIDRLRELAPLDIELCEQPIPAGRLDELARVREASPIPVFADEDVCTAADVARLVGAVDGVNLKLRKTGGIREFVRAAAVARAHGMKVMIGCDLESGVAATAQAHVAPLADHADVDGPLLLADDPFPGVSYEKGMLRLPPGPGLGVRAR
jgi:L-alanine-DL-glutamate epimerase-like enolase superfamily enzyme